MIGAQTDTHTHRHTDTQTYTDRWGGDRESVLVHNIQQVCSKAYTSPRGSTATQQHRNGGKRKQTTCQPNNNLARLTEQDFSRLSTAGGVSKKLFIQVKKKKHERTHTSTHDIRCIVLRTSPALYSSVSSRPPTFWPMAGHAEANWRREEEMSDTDDQRCAVFCKCVQPSVQPALCDVRHDISDESFITVTTLWETFTSRSLPQATSSTTSPSTATATITK